MVYGDTYASADDVVGHELAHGFTEFSSNLFYYYQSGAINESLSDVFGEFVDQTTASPDDTAADRWLMGESLPIGAIRDMENPGAFGHPDRMGSANYWTDRRRLGRRAHQQRRQQQGGVPADRRRHVQRPDRHRPGARRRSRASTTTSTRST